MANFMILLKKNLLEMVRNKRIIIFSIVFIAISFISALGAKFLPELIKVLLEGLEDAGMMPGAYIGDASVADSYAQFASNMGEIATLLVSVMFVGAIIKEKKTGTYTTLKENKVKDEEIVLSHFAAQIILVTVSYIVSVAFFAFLNILLFRQIMGVRGLVVLSYIYLLLLITISFSLFTGCLFKKSMPAYILVIGAYFLTMIVEVFPRINKFNPYHLITLSMNLVASKSYSLSENLTTVFTCLLMSVAFVIISLFIVKNRINNRGEINSDNTSERI